ncbi:MAG: hypothetical protein KA314_08875 [Chloroflexi bacterium]|nr:hypothetical protein [Chloroflexota bacterium]MBP8055942.1 hypothetical protein [Chloroflexota bacterium]
MNTKINLTNEQLSQNDEILARIEAEKERLLEETRALQQQWRQEERRKRALERQQKKKQA